MGQLRGVGQSYCYEVIGGLDILPDATSTSASERGRFMFRAARYIWK